MRPPLFINSSLEKLFTAITGPLPKSPPNSTTSPTFFPNAGIILTAVFYGFTTPIEISSAIIAKW